MDDRNDGEPDGSPFFVFPEKGGGVDVGGHRHHHAAGAGNDFGRRVLDAVFIGAGGIDLDHGGEGERRLSELGEL